MPAACRSGPHGCACASSIRAQGMSQVSNLHGPSRRKQSHLSYMAFARAVSGLKCFAPGLAGDPGRSWMGGLICFLLKKDAVLDIPGYCPVCLLETVYIRSCQPSSLIGSTGSRRDTGCWTPRRRGSAGCTPRSGRCRACTGPSRMRQSGVRPFSAATWTSRMCLAVWTTRRWLLELNVPDIDLLQSLYSGAYHQAELPYGRSAEVVPSREKQGNKRSPLSFCLIFDCSSPPRRPEWATSPSRTSGPRPAASHWRTTWRGSRGRRRCPASSTWWRVVRDADQTLAGQGLPRQPPHGLVPANPSSSLRHELAKAVQTRISIAALIS
jgi:hypothetical protein